MGLRRQLVRNPNTDMVVGLSNLTGPGSSTRMIMRRWPYIVCIWWVGLIISKPATNFFGSYELVRPPKVEKVRKVPKLTNNLRFVEIAFSSGEEQLTSCKKLQKLHFYNTPFV